jgi:hypothetical protein
VRSRPRRAPILTLLPLLLAVAAAACGDGRTASAGGIVLAEPGEGPGELARPTWLEIDALDSVFVWDRGTGRMSVFSPELDYVRTHRLEATGVGSSVRLPSGDWVHASPSDHGYPFRLVTAEGAVRTPWVLGPGSEGTIWAVPLQFRYEAVRFGAEGNELARLELESDWYESYERPEMVGPSKAPQPILTGIREDEDGLWIVGFVPDPGWRAALGEPYQVEGHTAYRVEDRSELLDKVIELRGTSTGELRARSRDDGLITEMMGGDRGLVTAWREDELGFQTFDVFRVRYESSGS